MQYLRRQKILGMMHGDVHLSRGRGSSQGQTKAGNSRNKPRHHVTRSMHQDMKCISTTTLKQELKVSWQLWASQRRSLANRLPPGASNLGFSRRYM